MKLVSAASSSPSSSEKIVNLKFYAYNETIRLFGKSLPFFKQFLNIIFIDNQLESINQIISIIINDSAPAIHQGLDSSLPEFRGLRVEEMRQVVFNFLRIIEVLT